MIKINLLDWRREKKIRAIKGELAVFFVVLFASWATMGFINYKLNSTIKQLNKKIEVAEVELARLKEIVKDVDKVEKTENRLKEIIRLIGELKKKQDKPVKLIDEINISLPPEIWLISIEQGETEVKIQGIAFNNPAIAYFMRRLENSNLFDRIELVETAQEIIMKEKVKKFSLRCFLRTAEDLNSPVIDTKVKS